MRPRERPCRRPSLRVGQSGRLRCPSVHAADAHAPAPAVALSALAPAATLALPANAPKGLLEEGKAALKAAVKLHAAQRDEARRRENEASAEKLALLKAVSRKNTASRDQEAERERQRLREGLVIDKQENDSWKQEYDVKQTLHRVATFTCRGPHGPILLHPSFRYRRR